MANSNAADPDYLSVRLRLRSRILGVGFGNFLEHRPSHQRESLGVRQRGDRRVGRRIELEAGFIAHFLERMARVQAAQLKASAVFVESEQAAIGQQGIGATRPVVLAVGSGAGSRDKVDLGNKNPARVLLAKKNHPGHQVIQIG